MNTLIGARISSANARRRSHVAAFFRASFIILALSALALLGLIGCNTAGNNNNGNYGNGNSHGNTNTNAQNTNVNGAVYQTYGVHNPPSDSPCKPPNCVYQRAPGEPADPTYPEYWVSGWNMYRVYKKFKEYPPPYDGAPPSQLVEGTDYEKSWGKTYYDSTTTWPAGEGAMMEYYENRCLPIFPISNKFTCAFISLGKIAYFVTYEKDRPAGMPPVCLFSGYNHPPRRNFIEHLPYSAGDSAQIGSGGQGYSFWVTVADGAVYQDGVKPIPDIMKYIMFGYGWQEKDGKMMPQSFYFSGFPAPPADAPFVSQNYVDFQTVKPNPAETWDQVKDLDPNTLPQCQLFTPPSDSKMVQGTQERAPTWADIGRVSKAVKEAK
jgi:hypothetical protein